MGSANVINFRFFFFFPNSFPLPFFYCSTRPGLARYPSSDSIHSYSSAATLTAVSAVSTFKSSPTLNVDQEHEIATGEENNMVSSD
jgi:hypothetical protein